MFAHEQAVDTIEQAQQQSRTRFFWFVNYLSDYTGFDFLWEPVPWQADQRHAWPSQHQTDSGTYLVPTAGYTDTNYHTAPVIHHMPDMSLWNVPAWIDPASIDPRWSPDPASPPYIYHFPVEWGWDRIGGPEYHVPGAIELNYVTDFVARTTADTANWKLHGSVYTTDPAINWRPAPTDPPYIYVFGNQWWPGEIMNTAEYCVPGATQVKYVDAPRFTLAEKHSNKWHTIEDCDWDYSWIPDPGDPPYIYVFGNQWHSAEIMPTVTYTVPGATERKYMDYPRARLLATHLHWDNITHHDYEFDHSWRPNPGEPPMIYVFGNQHWPAEKMPMLRYCSEPMDQGLPVKHMDYPRATLLPNREMWVLPEGVRDEQVDFSWVPDPGEPAYIYQFATQWQKTGGPQYHAPGATETKYLEHVEIKIETATVPIVEIDHLDGSAGNIPNTVKRIRYFDNYRDTLVRLAKSLVGEYEFVWVCSSICDYTDFDFSWHPEKWQSTMLHVFASNEQKFGDTFYMHVPTFAARAEKKALLEWYSVNYVPRIRVPRRPMPVIQHTEDSHVNAVKNTTWAGPLATFTTTDYVLGNMITVPLWRKETKTIVPLSAGASSVVVPRVAVGDVRTQLYDYAYIDKTHRMLKDHPLDIVFISNGESYAEFNYEHLKWAVQMEGLDCNHIHHSKGVNGRVAAYQAAARMSTTPWFFAVFAKLEVDHRFDWYWQPDRMQQPKHYIFHAHNPVNGLVYGHQAMIAYNKQMTLENTGEGLDFTMDQPHEVVPIISGTANYTESPWMAWRTAFREVLKLKDSLPDVESEYRLRMWLSNAGEVPNAEWSQWGAEDAVEYYDSVAGDFAALKKSYEWSWLASYAFIKRGLLTTS